MLLLEIFKLNSLHWSLFLEKLILQPTSGVAFCISVVLKIKEEDAELHEVLFCDKLREYVLVHTQLWSIVFQKGSRLNDGYISLIIMYTTFSF